MLKVWPGIPYQSVSLPAISPTYVPLLLLMMMIMYSKHVSVQSMCACVPVKLSFVFVILPSIFRTWLCPSYSFFFSKAEGQSLAKDAICIKKGNGTFSFLSKHGFVGYNNSKRKANLLPGRKTMFFLV